jgi:hypothetical protein
MMRDPDLQRPPTSGDVRVLVLPSGGTVEIPMPKSKSRAITIKPPASAFRGSAGGSITMPVILGVAVGVAVGGAIVWLVLRHKN